MEASDARQYQTDKIFSRAQWVIKNEIEHRIQEAIDKNERFMIYDVLGDESVYGHKKVTQCVISILKVREFCVKRQIIKSLLTGRQIYRISW